MPGPDHGGASPAEVVVPIADLVAGKQPPNHWIEAPPSEPTWRLDEPVALASDLATAQAISLDTASDTDVSEVDQPTRVPNPQGWIDDLLTSPIYGAQRRLAGRGAP
jgi:hypothetical protein